MNIWNRNEHFNENVMPAGLNRPHGINLLVGLCSGFDLRSPYHNLINRTGVSQESLLLAPQCVRLLFTCLFRLGRTVSGSDSPQSGGASGGPNPHREVINMVDVFLYTLSGGEGHLVAC